MSRVLLPYTGQAILTYLSAAVCAGIAGLGYLIDNVGIVVVFTGLAGILLVGGLIGHLFTTRVALSARALVESRGNLYWEYEGAEWQRFVDRERTTSSVLPWLLGGVCALGGGVLALLVFEEARPLFGGTAGHFVGVPIVTAGLGWGLGHAIAAMQRANVARMRAAQGIFCLGRQGAYLTGHFVPLHATQARLVGLEIEGDVLAFKITNGRATVRLRAPIPAARRAEAQQMVTRLRAAEDLVRA